jgi:excinuclease ABC subunit B
MFKLLTQFKPTGDQPHAINKLIQGVKFGFKNQVLLGVTGSGKTFTMANVIEKLQMPTLIISHNKTLAGQLFQEMRDFFPENAVSYFVSYYDYYQPEAYIPQTDTYIEKEAQINELIDKLRLQTTTNILTRNDVIVVASVSCIYNIGSPIEYGKFVLEIEVGQAVFEKEIFKRLAELQYERSEFDFKRGTFRSRGDRIDIYPAYEDVGYRLIFENGRVKKLEKFVLLLIFCFNFSSISKNFFV